MAFQAELRNTNQSAIVEEALAEWLEHREQEDRGATLRGELAAEIGKLSEQLHRSTERLAGMENDTRRSAEMVYALLETAFKNAGEADRQRVRYRAIENMRADRRQREESKKERRGGRGVDEEGFLVEG